MEIKGFNVRSSGRKDFDQPVKYNHRSGNWSIHQKSTTITQNNTTVQGDDDTFDCLLDYPYLNEN